MADRTIRTALDGADELDNQTVWDRWNAMAPHEQATAFLEHDGSYVALLEGLSAEKREGLEIKLGFLPFPLPLASIAGMRLNEALLHSWDVRVAFEPDAGLGDEAAQLLAEHFSGGLGFLLGFTGKADALTEPTVVDVGGFAIAVSDAVALVTPVPEVTATFPGY